jgi:hypothetical protein
MYVQIVIIGVLAFLVVFVTYHLMKAKKRIVELEKALGPEGVFSLDEAKLPARMHKEILGSLEWLRQLRQQIPTMDIATLQTIQGELTETHEMYCKAFGKDLIEKVSDQSGVQLKQALLLQIEISIGEVERQIAIKSV